jgi:4-hydroxyphenylacetate 3-monooxygenase
VLIHRNIEIIKTFYPRSGFLAGYQFQGCTRLAVKLDFHGRHHRQGVARGGVR